VPGQGATDLDVFRRYEPPELGPDGYPIAWHFCQAPDCDRGLKLVWDAAGNQDVLDCVRCDGTGKGVKHLVRAEAGHRCIRCGHPYRQGCGTWGDQPGEPVEATLALEATATEVLRRGREPRRPLWSPCDERCTHAGPIRMKAPDRFPGALHVPWIAHDATSVAPAGGHVERGRHVEAAWRILTVHHLNGDKADLRWWNLAALCQRCHLLIQRKVNMAQIYPGEHTPWFRPHAAGWYAATYQGRNLTRGEVMAELDDLLALERAW
jgi:hypothetical protein